MSIPIDLADPQAKEKWPEVAVALGQLLAGQYLPTDAAAELATKEDLAQAIAGVVVDPPAQTPADWSADAGAARILNKPTLGTAAGRDVGTGADQVAAGDHVHDGQYLSADAAAALATKADLAEAIAGVQIGPAGVTTEVFTASGTFERATDDVLYLIQLIDGGAGGAVEPAVRAAMEAAEGPAQRGRLAASPNLAPYCAKSASLRVL